MFGRKVLAFSLACLLTASPAFAVEDFEPLPSGDSGQPTAATEATAPDFGISPDKFVGDETIATGSDTDQPVDADS